MRIGLAIFNAVAESGTRTVFAWGIPCVDVPSATINSNM
jgi:hypothetical protein